MVLVQALGGILHLVKMIPAQAWISRVSGAQLYRVFGYYAFAQTTGQLCWGP